MDAGGPGSWRRAKLHAESLRSAAAPPPAPAIPSVPFSWTNRAKAGVGGAQLRAEPSSPSVAAPSGNGDTAAAAAPVVAAAADAAPSPGHKRSPDDGPSAGEMWLLPKGSKPAVAARLSRSLAPLRLAGVYSKPKARLAPPSRVTSPPPAAAPESAPVASAVSISDLLSFPPLAPLGKRTNGPRSLLAFSSSASTTFASASAASSPPLSATAVAAAAAAPVAPPDGQLKLGGAAKQTWPSLAVESAGSSAPVSGIRSGPPAAAALASSSALDDSLRRLPPFQYAVFLVKRAVKGSLDAIQRLLSMLHPAELSQLRLLLLRYKTSAAKAAAGGVAKVHPSLGAPLVLPRPSASNARSAKTASGRGKPSPSGGLSVGRMLSGGGASAAALAPTPLQLVERTIEAMLNKSRLGGAASSSLAAAAASKKAEPNRRGGVDADESAPEQPPPLELRPMHREQLVRILAGAFVTALGGVPERAGAKGGHRRATPVAAYMTADSGDHDGEFASGGVAAVVARRVGATTRRLSTLKKNMLKERVQNWLAVHAEVAPAFEASLAQRNAVKAAAQTAEDAARMRLRDAALEVIAARERALRQKRIDTGKLMPDGSPLPKNVGLGARAAPATAAPSAAASLATDKRKKATKSGGDGGTGAAAGSKGTAAAAAASSYRPAAAPRAPIVTKKQLRKLMKSLVAAGKAQDPIEAGKIAAELETARIAAMATTSLESPLTCTPAAAAAAAAGDAEGGGTLSGIAASEASFLSPTAVLASANTAPLRPPDAVCVDHAAVSDAQPPAAAANAAAACALDRNRAARLDEELAAVALCLAPPPGDSASPATAHDGAKEILVDARNDGAGGSGSPSIPKKNNTIHSPSSSLPPPAPAAASKRDDAEKLALRLAGMDITLSTLASTVTRLVPKVAPKVGSVVAGGGAGAAAPAATASNAGSVSGLSLSGVEAAAAASAFAGAAAASEVRALSSGVAVREYVDHDLSQELDEVVKEIVSTAYYYQERLRASEESSSSASSSAKKRRILIGLREVERGCKNGDVKILIMTPNMDDSRAEGGLNEHIFAILAAARSRSPPIPVVFALSRKKLGGVLGKAVRTSVVGLLSLDNLGPLPARMHALVSGLRVDFNRRKEGLPPLVRPAAASASAPALPPTAAVKGKAPAAAVNVGGAKGGGVGGRQAAAGGAGGGRAAQEAEKGSASFATSASAALPLPADVPTAMRRSVLSASAAPFYDSFSPTVPTDARAPVTGGPPWAFAAPPLPFAESYSHAPPVFSAPPPLPHHFSHPPPFRYGRPAPVHYYGGGGHAMSFFAAGAPPPYGGPGPGGGYAYAPPMPHFPPFGTTPPPHQGVAISAPPPTTAHPGQIWTPPLPPW